MINKTYKFFILLFLVLFGAFFMSGLISAGPATIGCNLSNVPGSIEVGESFTVSVSGSTQVGDQPLTILLDWGDDGSVLIEDESSNIYNKTHAHSYNNSGPKDIRLEVIDSANGLCEKTASVEVNAPPGSGVTSVDIKCNGAENCSIDYDAPAQISWNIVNAAGCSISQGIGSVSGSGQQTVGPLTSTTTYTLSCSVVSQAGGSGTDSTTVTVGPAPQGSPGPFNLSGSCSSVDSSTNRADLSWAPGSANATSYEVYHREWTGGTQRFLGTTTGTGFSDNVSSNIDYYYRVKAVNGQGSRNADPDWLFVCQAVAGPPPPGQSVLNAQSSGASSVSIARISGPSDIGGTTNYSRSYTTNVSAQVRAAATAPNGNAFVSWSGCNSTQSPRDCVVSVNTGQLKTVTANYSHAASCTDNSSIFSTSLPSSITMTPGETRNYSISMENTGNTRWYHPIVYALTQTTSGISINLTSPTSQHCQTYMSWLPVCFGKYPGDVMDWTFNISAPSSVGIYSFQMKMSHAGGEEYLKPDGTTCPAPAQSVLFGQTLSTTINVVPPDQAPIGYLDAANCSIIGGWSFDQDTPNTSITVDVYRDGPAGSGVFIGSYPTSGLRQDVNDAYGISGNHGYTITTPGSFKDGASHTVYVYGINSNPGGSNALLGNSPKTVSCPTVDLKVKEKGQSDSSYTDGPLSVPFNSKVTLKWTPVNASSCIASGDWSGSKSTSGGTEDQGPLNQTRRYDYNITCTGGMSGQANDSVSVDVGVASPAASNIAVTQPNYCVSGPAATVGWTYSDPSGGPQLAFQVQIDDQGSFQTPEWDSGKVHCEICRANATPQGYLAFNTTYRARVRVWTQNGGGVSDWTESSTWKTPNHAYPQVNFIWSPANPQATQPIQFTDQTVFYGGGNPSWSWLFGDGGSSTQQNPVKAYAENRTYNVTLTAFDGSGQSCLLTQPVNVRQANPIWKEINPGG